MAGLSTRPASLRSSTQQQQRQQQRQPWRIRTHGNDRKEAHNYCLVAVETRGYRHRRDAYRKELQRPGPPGDCGQGRAAAQTQRTETMRRQPVSAFLFLAACGAAQRAPFRLLTAEGPGAGAAQERDERRVVADLQTRMA